MSTPPPPPVFIVGTPRSGTTLVRLLLDSHPDLAIAPESAFLFRLAEKVTPHYKNLSSESALRKYIRDISETPRVRDWFPQSFDPTSLIQRVNQLGSIEVSAVINEIYSQYAHSRGKRFWGDKTPRNIEFFSQITALFPHAKFLIVVRDCRDVFLSLRQIGFGKLSAVSSALRWRNDARLANHLGATHPQAVKIVRYEDLLKTPSTILPEILTFFELRSDVDLEALYLQHDDDVRHSKSTLYKQPISAKNLGRWRSKITPQDLAICELIAGKELALFGYELQLAKPTVPRYVLLLLRLRDKISRLYNKTFLINYLGFSRLAARRCIEQVAGQ